jgi:hypothetical protein
MKEYTVVLNRQKGGRAKFASLGFKREYNPMHARTYEEKNLTEFTKVIEADEFNTLPSQYGKVIDRIEHELGIEVTTGNAPRIGAKCIGEIDVKFYEGDGFYRALWK